MKNDEVNIPIKDVNISGDLSIPNFSKGLIIFAHGSGSSRKSPRNRIVARGLNQVGFATLLFDLLTQEEESDLNNIFNIPLLSKRLLSVTKWAKEEERLKGLPIGYFGASTGAAAALMAATKQDNIFGVVSRGGRPDLALDHLEKLTIPVLLIVGENDRDVIILNEKAKKILNDCEMSIVQDATHLFEEPEALEKVAALASFWLEDKVSDYESKNDLAKPSKSIHVI
jgi:putative phosphoribosyl transferase